MQTMLSSSGHATRKVGFVSRCLDIKGRQTPLAIWLPLQENVVTTATAKYPHQISIKRIVKMLLGTKIIPNFSFLTKNFAIQDNEVFSCDEKQCEKLKQALKTPIVLASHGYLGSRFDLTHICKRLAKEGILAIAPELPESLAASYDTEWNSDESDKITRDEINREAIAAVKQEFIGNIDVGIGILGHSLGTGCAINFDTGKSDSPRCCIAGFRVPSHPEICIDSAFLVIASDSDTVCPRSVVNEKVTVFQDRAKKQRIETLYYNKYNHISFLWKETNDAMLQFLSPLLPLAKLLKIPLLNFDVYSEELDSEECHQEMTPVVARFFRQELMDNKNKDVDVQLNEFSSS